MNVPHATPAQDDINADLDTPPMDINSIGAKETRFPIWLFVIGGLVVIALLAAAAFFIKTSAPFLTSKKEEFPIASQDPDPSAAAAKLNITKPTSTTTETLPELSKNKSGNGPCPATVLIDKATQKPILNTNGIPITVDCNGAYSSSKIQPIGHTGAVPPITSGAEIVTPIQTDRYHGEVLLARQAQPKGESKITTGATLPQLPSPPVGAAEVLKQLQMLQTGQAVPLNTGANNPILNTPAAAAGNLPNPNTQGNPNNMLTSAKTERTYAVKAIDENLVVPKGTQIDCGLTTRAVTEISGFASCLVTRDVYSANGRVLLIERMSVADGEYAAQGQTGQRYIHVLWTRLRKPGGVTIDIASPATDGLGGAGIPAFVDNRWMERLGGAYLLSFIKDIMAYKTATDAATGQSTAAGMAYQNTTKTSESMAEKVLSNTIGIKPVLYANQGDRVAIYVARDLDFSKVYEVRGK